MNLTVLNAFSSITDFSFKKVKRKKLIKILLYNKQNRLFSNRRIRFRDFKLLAQNHGFYEWTNAAFLLLLLCPTWNFPGIFTFWLGTLTSGSAKQSQTQKWFILLQEMSQLKFVCRIKDKILWGGGLGFKKDWPFWVFPFAIFLASHW